MRRNTFERHDPARMPLSRAINDAHPSAPDLFKNLIIPEEPIPILTRDVVEQIIEGLLDRRMLAVTAAINACGKKTVQTKAVPHARCGPTFCADALFIFDTKRSRTGRRTHSGAEHKTRFKGCQCKF